MQITAVQNETGTKTNFCQLNQTQLCSSTLFHLLHTRTHTHTLVHMHCIAFVVDGWRMGADATRRKGLNCLGEGARGEAPVGPLGPGKFFSSSLC